MPNNLIQSYEVFKNAYLKLEQFINEDNSSEIARAGILHAEEIYLRIKNEHINTLKLFVEKFNLI